MNKRRKLNTKVAGLVASIIATDEGERKAPIPYHNSIRTGATYYDEIMSTNNMNRFKDITRCPSKETFEELVSCLETNGGLESTILISAGEKVLTFLDLVRKEKNSNRSISEIFQHSVSTTSATIHEVKDAIMKCLHLEIRQPIQNANIHESIHGDPKFSGFFDDAIGAVDGTLTDVSVDKDDPSNVSFICRKGYHAFNNIGFVDWDMLFTYFRAGWEGSGHDSKVYKDALLHGLIRRIHEYYLGDNAYKLTMYCLVPYKGVRYHLKEFSLGDRKPVNKEELFNLRHATKRNVVERTYGVIKIQFPILNSMPSYSIEDQVKLTQCCVFIYNFIRRRNLNWLFDDNENDDNNNDDDDNVNDDDDDNDDDNNEAKAFRDNIATNMWTAYQNELHRRRNG